MRHILLATVFAISAGCQALGDGHGYRTDEKSVADGRRRPGGLLQCNGDCDSKRSCELAKKDAAKTLPEPVKTACAWQDSNEPARVPPIGSDIVLVPKTVFVPYAAQSPNAAVRYTNTTPVVPLPDDGARLIPASTSKQSADANQLLLEMYSKLHDRLDSLEKKISEKHTNVLPPSQGPEPVTIVPSSPLSGSFNPPANIRRPALPNCEPLQPCEICPLPPVPLAIK